MPKTSEKVISEALIFKITNHAAVQADFATEGLSTPEEIAQRSKCKKGHNANGTARIVSEALELLPCLSLPTLQALAVISLTRDVVRRDGLCTVHRIKALPFLTPPLLGCKTQQSEGGIGRLWSGRDDRHRGCDERGAPRYDRHAQR